MTTYNIREIRKMLKAAFNDSEFRDFCQDNFPDVEKEFSRGMPLGDKVSLLIGYCNRQGKVTELVDLVALYNPYQHTLFKPRIFSSGQLIQTSYRIDFLATGIVEFEIPSHVDLAKLTPIEQQRLKDGFRLTLAIVLGQPVEMFRIQELRNGSLIFRVLMPQDLIQKLSSNAELVEELGVVRMRRILDEEPSYTTESPYFQTTQAEQMTSFHGSVSGTIHTGSGDINIDNRPSEKAEKATLFMSILNYLGESGLGRAIKEPLTFVVYFAMIVGSIFFVNWIVPDSVADTVTAIYVFVLIIWWITKE